jgi:hypothetical protein
VAGEALSPKVWLRWAKRSMLPGPKMKVPPSRKGLLVLVVAGGFGALAAFEIISPEEVEDVGGFKVGNFVGLATLVDEEGEVDAGFLLEDAGVVGVAEADGGEGSALFAEQLLAFAQLRDMLATKESAVVAEEDHDGGIVFPEPAQAGGFAEGVGKNDAGELFTQGFGHDGK